MIPPPPPRGVSGKFSLFNGLAAVISRKHFVLRYLESNYLKTKCLSGALRDARREQDNAGSRTMHDSQLQVNGFSRNNRQMGGRWKVLMKMEIARSDRESSLTMRGQTLAGGSHRLTARGVRNPKTSGTCEGRGRRPWATGQIDIQIFAHKVKIAGGVAPRNASKCGVLTGRIRRCSFCG